MLMIITWIGDGGGEWEWGTEQEILMHESVKMKPIILYDG